MPRVQVRHWWQHYPDRWDAELRAFTARGWETTVVEEEAQYGIIAVQARCLRRDLGLPPDQAATDGHDRAQGDRPVADRAGVVRLLVRYPAAYPFFPPEVSDPDGGLTALLPRHRNPTTDVVCLTRPADWQLATTAAELIITQLPHALAAAAAPVGAPVGAAAGAATGAVVGGPVSVREVRAGEPVGAFVAATVVHRVLVDSRWRVPASTTQGPLEVAFIPTVEGDLCAGAVTALQGERLRLRRLPARLTGQFPVRVPGRWLRAPDLDPDLGLGGVWDPEMLWRRVRPRVAATPIPGGGDAAGAEVIGLLVPSELTYRQAGEEWLFLVRTQARGAPTPRVDLYRSCFAGAGDVAARSPATTRCRRRRVLLVGVGALGGPMATELARAGVGHLVLVDPDHVDPATACRQIAPAIWAGTPKVVALHEVLATHTPHCTVGGWSLTIGAVQRPVDGASSTHLLLGTHIQRADLVIDAAADPAVSRYLAALCGAAETTLLHVSATAGARGGIVAVLPPGGGGCWWCLLHHRADGTVPYPPHDPAGGVIAPPGCTDPTFTGTGADLATIATHAARVALWQLATRTPGRSTLYTAALRDRRRRPIPVRWETTPLPVHPQCPVTSAHPTPDGSPDLDPPSPPLAEGGRDQ